RRNSLVVLGAVASSVAETASRPWSVAAPVVELEVELEEPLDRREPAFLNEAGMTGMFVVGAVRSRVRELHREREAVSALSSRLPQHLEAPHAGNRRELVARCAQRAR